MEHSAHQDAIERIKKLKARYFYCLDGKDWTGWGDVFAQDAVMDVRGEYPEGDDRATHLVEGREAIVTMVSDSLADIVTVHHGHTPMIDLDGEDAARGIWAMEDNLFMPDGSRMTGYGHYIEEYTKADGRWRIARLRLTRLHKVFS